MPSRVERQRQCDRLRAVSRGSVPAPAQPAQLPVLCHQLHHRSARLHIRLSLSAWVSLVCLRNYVTDWLLRLLRLHPGCGCEWGNARFVPELIQDQDTEAVFVSYRLVLMLVNCLICSMGLFLFLFIFLRTCFQHLAEVECKPSFPPAFRCSGGLV